MNIKEMVYQANARKRKNARKAAAQKWTVGICVVSTAAAMGVVTGILIAPKSGEETRADLKKNAVKSVATVKNAVMKKADALKDFTEDAAQEVTGAIRGVSAKAESAIKST